VDERSRIGRLIGEIIPEFQARALLFDMDGVLLDSRPIVERTWRRWAERHGLAAESILNVAHGRRTRDTLQAGAPGLATDEEVAWLDAAELEDFEGIRPIAGAQALISSLPSSRWTVVTSAGRELAMRRLDAIALALPAHAVTGDDVQRGKPAPDGYLLAAARLGVNAEDCLVIEDAPPGIRAGHASGARVIAVTTTYPREALADADLIIPDLNALRVVGVAPALTLAVAHSAELGP
jgi:sugar-phosphatase